MTTFRESHPDSVISKTAREVERARCIAICEGWIGTWQDKEIKYTSAREYAVDAIEDIIDLIREGHQPGSVSVGERS